MGYKPKQPPAPEGQLTFLVVTETPEQGAIAAQQQQQHDALAQRDELDRLCSEVEKWKRKFQSLYQEYEEISGQVRASEAWWKAQVADLQEKLSRATAEGQNAQIAQLQQQRQILANTNRDIKHDRDLLQEECRTLHKTVGHLTERLVELEGELLRHGEPRALAG